MIPTTDVRVKDLPKGEWVVLENKTALYFEHTIVKVEENKLFVLDVEEPESGGVFVRTKASVIEEPIFMFNEILADFSLNNSTLEELLELVLNNTENTEEFTSLVFDMLHYSDEKLLDMYPNYSELRKHVYIEEVNHEELKDLRIGGKELSLE